MDAGQQPRTSEYANFRILVDDPADDPALGFADYADAFAEIITRSPPRFAIGIFGSWGSGKTTLMKAIQARIEGRKDVIPVWFNAWRYEREQHLIIPLLDVLQEAVLEWTEEHERETRKDMTITARGRRAAAAMGAAARAIAIGVSLSARLPGGVAEAKLDLEKVLASMAAEDRIPEPVSLYHASFVTMEKAVEGFVTAGGRRPPGGGEPSPQRRIVVFVDDLDRCLPLNALTVLESMKLFFDLEGFVFVAGLDQEVIERAVELRYSDPHSREADERPSAGDANTDGQPRGDLIPSAGPISGRDYIKKIFQVPFGLPAVDRSLLEELVSKLVETRKLAPAQKRELTGRILKHLRYFSDEGGINPREIKRLINAYTLQAKLMSLKLPRIDPGAKVDLDTILALQVIGFRPDWERIWRRLEADADGFVSRFTEGLAERRRRGDAGRAERAEPVWVDGEPLPPQFVDYLTTGPASSLKTNRQLKAYVMNSQASQTSDPRILQAQAAVDDLRRFTRDVDQTTDRPKLSAILHERLDRLRSKLADATWARQLHPLLAQLESDASALAAGDDAPEIPLGEWTDGFRARLDRLDADLRDLRDRFSLRGA